MLSNDDWKRRPRKLGADRNDKSIKSLSRGIPTYIIGFTYLD